MMMKRVDSEAEHEEDGEMNPTDDVVFTPPPPPP